ncbi:MAG: hypothetical protein JWO89_2885 [Verrucomicrobiaceae bacterium]|nr:hypothetical protein [Verrucomicrobiaceae bacterium]
MKFFAILLTSALLVSHAQAADSKFGVVDMVKAFTEFYKTKDASSKIKGNKDKAMNEMNERYATYKTLTADALKLGKQAQDPILTQAARGDAQAKYQDKVKEVNNLTQENEEFQRRRSMQLRQEEMELQKGIYEEIVAVVKDKSKAGGYDLVFDKSGVSMNTVPVLLAFKDAVDFTDEVIVELNKNAPPESAKKEEEKPKADADKKTPAKEESKPKSKKSK